MLTHKHIFPGGDEGKCTGCGEYPVCICNKPRHLSYCPCYEKPKRKAKGKKGTK
jgi:hypothetical protein